MCTRERPLFWVGSSKKDLMALPVEVRKFFGHALNFAQEGEQHDAVKVMKGFGSAGVLEVVEDDAGGTYRAVYIALLSEEKPERNRHTAKGNSDYSRAAEDR
jgi:phage-related protein